MQIAAEKPNSQDCKAECLFAVILKLTDQMRGGFMGGGGGLPLMTERHHCM